MKAPATTGQPPNGKSAIAGLHVAPTVRNANYDQNVHIGGAHNKPPGNNQLQPIFKNADANALSNRLREDLVARQQIVAKCYTERQIFNNADPGNPSRKYLLHGHLTNAASVRYNERQFQGRELEFSPLGADGNDADKTKDLQYEIQVQIRRQQTGTVRQLRGFKRNRERFAHAAALHAASSAG